MPKPPKPSELQFDTSGLADDGEPLDDDDDSAEIEDAGHAEYVTEYTELPPVELEYEDPEEELGPDPEPEEPQNRERYEPSHIASELDKWEESARAQERAREVAQTARVARNKKQVETGIKEVDVGLQDQVLHAMEHAPMREMGEKDQDYAQRLAANFLPQAILTHALNLTSKSERVRQVSAKALQEAAVGKAPTQEPPEDETNGKSRLLLDLPYGKTTSPNGPRAARSIATSPARKPQLPVAGASTPTAAKLHTKPSGSRAPK